MLYAVCSSFSLLIVDELETLSKCRPFLCPTEQQLEHHCMKSLQSWDNWSKSYYNRSQSTKQGNREYQSSPALCNPTIPFGADRPHRLRPEIFRILFAVTWRTDWSLLLHHVIGNWMIPFAANAAVTPQRPLQQRLSMLSNGPDNPRKLPLPLRIGFPI